MDKLTILLVGWFLGALFTVWDMAYNVLPIIIAGME